MAMSPTLVSSCIYFTCLVQSHCIAEQADVFTALLLHGPEEGAPVSRGALLFMLGASAPAGLPGWEMTYGRKEGIWPIWSMLALGKVLPFLCISFPSGPATNFLLHAHHLQ